MFWRQNENSLDEIGWLLLLHWDCTQRFNNKICCVCCAQNGGQSWSVRQTKWEKSSFVRLALTSVLCIMSDCLLKSNCYSLIYSQCPWTGSKKRNSSEVWCVFLKTKLYDNFKKCFLINFRLHPSPLDTPIFWKKHPKEKWQKVDLHYFQF